MEGLYRAASEYEVSSYWSCTVTRDGKATCKKPMPPTIIHGVEAARMLSSKTGVDLWNNLEPASTTNKAYIVYVIGGGNMEKELLNEVEQGEEVNYKTVKKSFDTYLSKNEMTKDKTIFVLDGDTLQTNSPFTQYINDKIEEGFSMECVRGINSGNLFGQSNMCAITWLSGKELKDQNEDSKEEYKKNFEGMNTISQKRQKNITFPIVDQANKYNRARATHVFAMFVKTSQPESQGMKDFESVKKDFIQEKKLTTTNTVSGIYKKKKVREE
jgi:hypothetical protein